MLCNGNGFFEIEVYGDYKGRVEILYVRATEYIMNFEPILMKILDNYTTDITDKKLNF